MSPLGDLEMHADALYRIHFECNLKVSVLEDMEYALFSAWKKRHEAMYQRDADINDVTLAKQVMEISKRKLFGPFN